MKESQAPNDEEPEADDDEHAKPAASKGGAVGKGL